MRQPNADAYADAYSYRYADGNLYAYCDGYAYCYRGTEVYADAKATSHSPAAPVASTLSWLDSGTRERKLASSCLWMESAFHLSELSMFPIKGSGPREKI